MAMRLFGSVHNNTIDRNDRPTFYINPFTLAFSAPSEVTSRTSEYDFGTMYIAIAQPLTYYINTERSSTYNII